MRKRRRSRRNSWPGAPRLHAKAARKGHRRSRRTRRTRRNAGSMSMVRNTTRSLRAGFDPKILKRASAILLGNISTTWYVDQIASRVPMLRSSPVFDIGALLLLGGAQGVFVSHILKQPKYATDIMIGGILAGVTRAVKMVLPNQFSTCGLGEDMEGLGDYIYPGVGVVTLNGQWVQRLNGLGAFARPGAPLIGTHGLGDEAMYHQVQPTNVIQLDGMADAEMQREIAMQM